MLDQRVCVSALVRMWWAESLVDPDYKFLLPLLGKRSSGSAIDIWIQRPEGTIVSTYSDLLHNRRISLSNSSIF